MKISTDLVYHSLLFLLLSLLMSYPTLVLGRAGSESMYILDENDLKQGGRVFEMDEILLRDNMIMVAIGYSTENRSKHKYILDPVIKRLKETSQKIYKEGKMYADYYIEIIENISKQDITWLSKELDRLSGLFQKIEDGQLKLTAKESTELERRQNIANFIYMKAADAAVEVAMSGTPPPVWTKDEL